MRIPLSPWFDWKLVKRIMREPHASQSVCLVLCVWMSQLALIAATDFSPWDLRSSYPYFADDQPTVGIFFLISDMNQVLLSLLLDYVETNQPLQYLWNIIIIKVKQHGWRHGWLNGHDLCLFFRSFQSWTQDSLLLHRWLCLSLPSVSSNGAISLL